MRLLAATFGLLGSSAHCAVLLQDPLPLAEYYDRTLKDYTGLTWDQITPQNAAKMIRVQNLGDAEFKELVRRGYPFIVDDCAPATALQEFSCAEYGRRWPNEHMRAEYTPEQHHIYLKDKTWHSVQKPTVKAEKHLSLGKPLSGPYIWHVKDETEDPQTKRTLMDIFPVPYFLNRSALNFREARDSFEFWFVLENGGSQAHADAYCETTISLQLRGRKTWRLGAFPNISNAFEPHAFHDAEIYRHEDYWRPEHEELVEPGQCVVFPMGYIHETYVSEGSAGEDGCSVATTFQFQDPQPVHLWKNFLARWGLSHYAREEPCLQRMEAYVYLGAQFGKVKTPAREDAVRAWCQKVFTGLDTNQDEMVSLNELLVQYRRFRFQPPWSEHPAQGLRAELEAEKAQWMAEDALLYHDDNRDSVVSLEEFTTSVLKFTAVRMRLRSIKTTKDRKKLLGSERQWIQQHMCTDGDCQLLERLERDASRSASKRRRSEL